MIPKTRAPALLALATAVLTTALGGARAGEGPGEQTVTLAVVPLPPEKVGSGE